MFWGGGREGASKLEKGAASLSRRGIGEDKGGKRGGEFFVYENLDLRAGSLGLVKGEREKSSDRGKKKNRPGLHHKEKKKRLTHTGEEKLCFRGGGQKGNLTKKEERHILRNRGGEKGEKRNDPTYLEGEKARTSGGKGGKGNDCMPFTWEGRAIETREGYAV